MSAYGLSAKEESVYRKFVDLMSELGDPNLVEALINDAQKDVRDILRSQLSAQPLLQQNGGIDSANRQRPSVSPKVVNSTANKNTGSFT